MIEEIRKSVETVLKNGITVFTVYIKSFSKELSKFAVTQYPVKTIISL